MKKRFLLGIDWQYGFIEGGKLGVTGATAIADRACEFVEKNGMNYEGAAETVDWHPVDHCSFKENGGVWPLHCTQHSHDAAIYEPMLKALNDNTKSLMILTKGTNPDHEEYSVFKNEESCKKLVDLVTRLGIEEIDVFGIAYDYCVADSVKDGLRVLPNVKFNVLKDLCPAISEDTANEFTKFIENTERVCLVEG